MKIKTIGEINKKILSGKAIVITANDLCKAVRNGERITASDVDIVTSGTCGLMSGTAAILSFPITKRNVFRKAKMVSLNGVPAFPGPAPNERLGEIDLIVYGTSISTSRPRYGGGHLFRDIVAGKEITVVIKTDEGKIIKSGIAMNNMTYARLLAIRNVFKNYVGFINKQNDKVKTIFNVTKMKGPYKEFTFCGCGELNPLEKDPQLKTIGIGSKCIINGSLGYITGLGTRGTEEKPNLSGFANMFDMKTKYMGGFVTSGGIEAISSWAIPIPILDQKILSNAIKTDENTKLPIADIHDRIPFYSTNYGKVWQNVDLNIKFDKNICKKSGKGCAEKNSTCPVDSLCPTNAFSFSRGSIDKTLCFNCGACVVICKHHAFLGKLGSIRVDGKEVPVTLRQSNKLKAIEIANELKYKIENGSFLLNEPASRITFYKKNDSPS